MASPSPACPPSSFELQAILDVAVSAARRAGAHMRAHLGTASAGVQTTKANFKDVVTAVDLACQAKIAEVLAASLPAVQYTMLGEEDVAAGSAASAAALSAATSSTTAPYLFVVDPLDGTTNFASGLPCSCVSIGVAHRGVVVAACIFDPYREETFTATRGGGAFLNGARLRVAAPPPTLGAAVMSVGFHSDAAVGAIMMRGAAAMLQQCRGIRNLGSAALHLAYVAAGRLAGFWELDLSSWDIAAGFLLVAEAGGVVTDMRGAPYALATRDVIATAGGQLHADALAVLAEAGAQHMPTKE